MSGVVVGVLWWHGWHIVDPLGIPWGLREATRERSERNPERSEGGKNAIAVRGLEPCFNVYYKRPFSS